MTTDIEKPKRKNKLSFYLAEITNLRKQTPENPRTGKPFTWEEATQAYFSLKNKYEDMRILNELEDFIKYYFFVECCYIHSTRTRGEPIPCAKLHKHSETPK
jgi:hypothetical protein